MGARNAATRGARVCVHCYGALSLSVLALLRVTRANTWHHHTPYLRTYHTLAPL